MTPTQAARVSWAEYTAALQALAAPRGAQFDLLALGEGTARAKFWRETWLACEREVARVRA